MTVSYSKQPTHGSTSHPKPLRYLFSTARRALFLFSFNIHIKFFPWGVGCAMSLSYSWQSYTLSSSVFTLLMPASPQCLRVFFGIQALMLPSTSRPSHVYLFVHTIQSTLRSDKKKSRKLSWGMKMRILVFILSLHSQHFISITRVFSGVLYLTWILTGLVWTK